MYPLTDEQVIPVIRTIKTSIGKDRSELIVSAVDSLMYMVYSKAKRYKGQPFYEDLLQEGRMALITAIEKFDESRSMHFFYFAEWYIKTYFRNFLDLALFKPQEVYKSIKKMRQSDDFYYDKDPVEETDIKRVIDVHLDRLDSKTKDVLILKFGLGKESIHTFKEIGDKYNVSRQRIEQIKNLAFGKLKNRRELKELHYGGM